MYLSGMRGSERLLYMFPETVVYVARDCRICGERLSYVWRETILRVARHARERREVGPELERSGARPREGGGAAPLSLDPHPRVPLDCLREFISIKVFYQSFC
jgi:hypothetical protein